MSNISEQIRERFENFYRKYHKELFCFEQF